MIKYDDHESSFDNGNFVDEVYEYLHDHGWSYGLINLFWESCKEFPVRYFVVDNSKSMLCNDGHLLDSKTKKRYAFQV